MKLEGFCNVTGKVLHLSYDQAQKQLISLRRRNKVRKRKRAHGCIYRCHHCSGWHVSSQSEYGSGYGK